MITAAELCGVVSIAMSGERRVVRRDLDTTPPKEKSGPVPKGHLLERIRVWCRTAERITAAEISTEFETTTKYAAMLACRLEVQGFLQCVGKIRYGSGGRPAHLWEIA